MIAAAATSTVVVVESAPGGVAQLIVAALVAFFGPIALAALVAWLRALRQKKTLAQQLDAVIAAVEQAPPAESQKVKGAVSQSMRALGLEEQFHERVKQVTSTSIKAFRNGDEPSPSGGSS